MPSENYDFVPWDSPDDIEKFLGLGAALQGARALGGKVLSAGTKLNTKRLALRNKIGEKLVPAAKNLITGKKEGPLASSPASEAVESMPSAPAPEMPEPEMPETPSGPDPNIALGRGEASGFNPKKKQNQAMQYAQQSLASSQQRKQAQEQRAIEMARRGSEVGKAAPIDMAWRLLKTRTNRDEENRIESKFERLQRKIEDANTDALEQLEIPFQDERYSRRAFPTPRDDEFARDERDRRARTDPDSSGLHRRPRYSLDDIAEFLARRREDRRKGVRGDRGFGNDIQAELEREMGLEELYQSTLPMPLPFRPALRTAIENRPDFKIDRDAQTFTRILPGRKTRQEFEQGYKDRMQFKEGRPTPTKVEVRPLGRSGREFVLTDDDGREYTRLGGNVLHHDSINNIPNTTNTLYGINSATPEPHRRRGYYQNLLDTILQNKIGIISDNRNPAYSQPFHEKFQQRLPTNIIAGGGEIAPSKSTTELRQRTGNEYRYGYDSDFEEEALKNIDTTGWGDLKPMFGSQYPMFGTIDKPVLPDTPTIPARVKITTQDNSDPTTPRRVDYRQASLDEYKRKLGTSIEEQKRQTKENWDELRRLYG